MLDNTWATPLIYRPLDHGIDLAIYAGTKYQGGHSDLLIGSISANAKALAGAAAPAHAISASRPARRKSG